MLKCIVSCLLVALVSAEWFEESYERFKGDQGKFQTGYHSQFAGWSLEQVQRLMGARRDGKSYYTPRVQFVEDLDEASLPGSFLCSQKWPKCKGVFGYIKDQAGCGSCWAVSASNVAAGRICIAHGGPDPNAEVGSKAGNIFLNEPVPPIDMSSQQIMSCCNYCGDGCKGGYPEDAMYYMMEAGVVTGGWYGSNCGCYPYEIPPCGPSGCSEGPTPRCKRTCTSKNYATSYNADKHHATDHYKISSSVSQIQHEIMTNGPIECAFDVYENFMHYNSGVYDRRDGQFLGGHAVTNYGWGVYQGTPYWMFHNSWNVTWGLPAPYRGQFRFKRGGDLCGMESGCVAAKFGGKKQSWGLHC